jgi:hypothetical protein
MSRTSRSGDGLESVYVIARDHDKQLIEGEIASLNAGLLPVPAWPRGKLQEAATTVDYLRPVDKVHLFSADELLDRTQRRRRRASSRRA